MPSTPSRHLLAAAAALGAMLTLGAATPAAWAENAAPPAAAPGAAPGAANNATTMCGTYDELHAFLNDQFDEHPASSGLADDGTIMQVFSSAGAGTWTLVSVDPGGHACVVATGQAWQQEASMRRGEPA